MFNSQKINTDPTPLYTVLMYARNGVPAKWTMRTVNEDMAIETALDNYPNHDVHTVSVTYNRPEYDNNPNPILTRFREYVEERTDAALYYSLALVEDALTAIRYHEGELAWERGADEGTDELFGALREFADNTSFTEHAEHINHARKVLEKIANLMEETS